MREQRVAGQAAGPKTDVTGQAGVPEMTKATPEVLANLRNTYPFLEGARTVVCSARSWPRTHLGVKDASALDTVWLLSLSPERGIPASLRRLYEAGCVMGYETMRHLCHGEALPAGQALWAYYSAAADSLMVGVGKRPPGV